MAASLTVRGEENCYFMAPGGSVPSEFDEQFLRHLSRKVWYEQ